MLRLSISKDCLIENCGKRVVGRDMCRKHYQRWWKYGDATYITPLNKDKFWALVDKTPGFGRDGSCWIFTGHKDEDGYGRLSIEGHRQFAHRYVFFLTHGHYPEPIGRHTCDNPPCCRPEHIIEGTSQDNVADRQERGRQWHPKGELHGASKLTEDVVRQIKYGTEMGSVIAATYNISRGLVTMIRQGKRWSHI